MDKIPYFGAVELVMNKKERKFTKKLISRAKIYCTCGALKKFFTALPRYHEEFCCINKKEK